MKNKFHNGSHRKGNNFAQKSQFNTFRYDAYIIIGSIIILIGFLFTGCKKESRETVEFEIQHNNYYEKQSVGVFNPGNPLIHDH